MGPFLVVQLDVIADRAPGVADRLVGPQVDFFVLDAAPYALDEYVVALSAFAVHRQLNTSAQYRLGECACRELASLIGVHDVRVPIAGKRFFQRLDGMHRLQRNGHAVRNNLATRPSTTAVK